MMHLCGICISRHPSKETFALDREYRLAVTRRHGPSVGHEDNIYWGNLILRYALPSRLWSGRTRKQSNSLALPSISKKVGTRCRSPSYERFGRMQFTLHTTRRTPHGASRLVQAMPAWLVKTRRAPSRHSGDARVYGHTTTAMHKRSTWCTPIYLGGFTKTK